jgi:hypothetical protein
VGLGRQFGAPRAPAWAGYEPGQSEPFNQIRRSALDVGLTKSIGHRIPNPNSHFCSFPFLRSAAAARSESSGRRCSWRVVEEGGGAAVGPLARARARPRLSSPPSSGLGNGAWSMRARHGITPASDISSFSFPQAS